MPKLPDLEQTAASLPCHPSLLEVVASFLSQLAVYPCRYPSPFFGGGSCLTGRLTDRVDVAALIAVPSVG